MPSDPMFRPKPHRADPDATVKLNRAALEKNRLTKFQKLNIAIKGYKLINQIRTMKLKGSWITSLFGASGLGTILWNVTSMLLDGDPNTNPDWSVTLPAIITSAALLFTKDFNKSNAQHPTATAKPV